MLSTGIDVVDVRRVARYVQRFGVSFLKHVYGPSERERYSHDVDLMATAFAAKEAVAKTLGVGLAYIARCGVLLPEIEITLQSAPESPTAPVRLLGAARERAIDLRLERWALRVKRLDHHALALVIAASADVSQPTINDALTLADSCLGSRH